MWDILDGASSLLRPHVVFELCDTRNKREPCIAVRRARPQLGKKGSAAFVAPCLLEAVQLRGALDSFPKAFFFACSSWHPGCNQGIKSHIVDDAGTNASGFHAPTEEGCFASRR